MALTATSLLAWVMTIFTALVTADVDPVIIKGSHFFYQTNGSEFFIRGVTYQTQSNSSSKLLDPLAALTCMRDITFLNQLTTNVIRVSYIDTTQDHTACMIALQNAGIYILVDLPGTVSINNTNPEWNLDIYNSWTQTIDAIAGNNNVLGFFAGNNLVTNSSNSPAAAFLKAAVRDLKAYINSKYSRAIPIGYQFSIADNYDIMASYMVCSNSSEAIDFLGISDFDSCSNDTSSSFDLVSEEYANYPVPVFFADYGCKDVVGSARAFEEVAYIYGNPMTNVISGGIVFEYFQDDEQMGLVSVIGTQISALPDFTSYSSQIAKITPSSTHASNYVITNTITPSCPTGPAFSASPTLPPVVNQSVCTCMMSSLTCVAKPGLDSETSASVYENICGPSAEKCPGLQGDGSNGTYGAYSMCTSTERLSWALDVHYRYDPLGCSYDANAAIQNSSITADCETILNIAGNLGTGTMTSYLSSTTSIKTGSGTNAPSAEYHANKEGALSHGAIVGISVASAFIFAAVVLGTVSHFCIRTRGFTRQKCASLNNNRIYARHLDGSDRPSVLRGGNTSNFSEDSRVMSEPTLFNWRKMWSWSRSDFQSSRSEVPGQGSISEPVSLVLSPVSQHSTIEGVGSVIPPSPMSSVKELPAFRSQTEDKSLANMKLLAPIFQVTPALDNGLCASNRP